MFTDVTTMESGWDVRVLQLDDPPRWWWNAWHLTTATERSGEAGTRTQAEEAMRRSIEQAVDMLRRVVELRPASWEDDQLSSVALRLTVRPPVLSAGPGPVETRPFGLRFAQRRAIGDRPSVRYCHTLQVAVDQHGCPLIEAGDDKEAKQWESKTYSDGDEGQEEECWGWEEQ